MANTYKALEAMQSMGMPLLVHGEVTDSNIDVFDRKAVFINEHLIPLRRDFHELKIVLEHITTREATQYVAQAGRNTAATVTAHYLLHNRNALFLGGMLYCPADESGPPKKSPAPCEGGAVSKPF